MPILLFPLGAGQVTSTVSLSARSSVQGKSQAGPSGVVPLAARSTTMAKSAAAFTTGGLAALAARSMAMARSAAAAVGAVPLQGRATGQGKAPSGMSPSVGLAARSAAMAASRGFFARVAGLSAVSIGMARAALGQPKGTLTLTGRMFARLAGRLSTAPPIVLAPDQAFAADFALNAAPASDRANFAAPASDRANFQVVTSGSNALATYQIDTSAQINGTFTNSVTGVATDPSTITLFLQPPSGPLQTLVFGQSSIVRDGPGLYHYVLTLNISGTWTYKWQGTGAVIATSPDTTLTVVQSVLIPG